jgi:hypothetical protein
MSIMTKLFAVAGAIKKGECLKDPATWKNKQLLMNTFLAIVALIPQFTSIPISEAEQNAIVYGIVTIAGVINTYLSAATSDKVGL